MKKNTEKVAEFLVATYGEGLKIPHIDSEGYSFGEILCYYAKEVAELRHQVSEYERKIDEISSAYIRKHSGDTEEEARCYGCFNNGIDVAMRRLDINKCLLMKEDRDEYY